MMVRYFSSLFIILFLATSCAQKRIPGGGPVDKQPPFAITILPDSININTKHLFPVTVTFNEMMDQSSVYKSIRVMPPNYKFDIEIANFNEVRIIPQESDSLLNETVVVSFGNELTDLRKNPLKKPLIIVYTPNDSIPKGFITGRAYGQNQYKNYQIWAFSKSDTLFETPLRYTYPGKNGSYTLPFLKDPSAYIPIVIKDEGTRFKADNSDLIFLPYKYEASDKYDFWRSIIPKGGVFPDISKFSIVKKNLITWQMDGYLNPEIFRFYSDTLTIMPKFCYMDPQKKGYYYAWFDSLEFNEITMSWKYDTTMQQRSVELEDKVETIKFVLKPEKQDQALLPVDTIRLFSTLPLDSTLLPEFTASRNISAQYIFENPVEINVIPVKPWPMGQTFSVDFRYQPRDTTISFRFSCIAKRDAGTISGKIVDKKTDDRVLYHIIVNDIDRKKQYELITRSKNFRFDFLKEGFYSLNAWKDLDGDGNYSVGNLIPFLPPEPFWFSNDTLKVRKRWENHSSVIIF